MASLDSLPPDQRAVLDLVLQRGRSYDDIARLLAIDRAGVRARALAALDGIGPDTGLAPETRALITDYLLGQLPAKVAEQTRDRLAESPYERAWARVLASELQPVASKPLPEIPNGTARAKAQAPAGDAAPAPAPVPERPGPGPEPRPPKADRGPRRPERTRLPRPSDRPSSRLGGAIFLAVGAIVVVALVVVLIAVISSGKSSKNSSSVSAVAPGSSSTTHSSTAPATGTGGTTSTTGAKVVGQINLNPPSGTGAAKGVAFLVQAGSALGVIIEATGLAPNSHNAYAVWLSNTPSDSTRVGFVNQAVGKNGKLQTGGPLPANASHFKELLLTLETQNNPKAPGTTILQGALKLTS
jgi:Sigma-70, region 4